jgi:hypothetical protein
MIIDNEDGWIVSIILICIISISERIYANRFIFFMFLVASIVYSIQFSFSSNGKFYDRIFLSILNELVTLIS